MDMAVEKKYVFILFAVVFLVLIRSTIALDLVSLHTILVFSRRVAIAVSTIIIILHAIALFEHRRKMQKLPGLSLRLSWRMIYSLLSKDRRRGFPFTVVTNEILKAAPIFRFEGDDGDMFAVSLWTRTLVFVTSAEAIKEVVNHPHAQNKGSVYSIIALVIGDGLLTSNGDKWKTHRKLLTPSFHLKILESLMSVAVPRAELLTHKLEEEASKKADRSVDDIIPYIFDCIMDILCQSSMGVESADESIMATLRDGLTCTVDMIMNCMFNPLFLVDCFLGLSERGKHFKKTRGAFQRLEDDVISNRMAVLRGKINDDSSAGRMSLARRKEPLIDIMIREHWRSPHTFSSADMREETTTFTAAGADTTLWSITYTLLLLGHHPEVQEKLYRELQEFSVDSDLSDLTFELVNRFTYLNAVFNESLRLFPPVPNVTRKADEDITIRGRVIPKGTEIILSIMSVHRDERYWPDPHRFKPERFLSRAPEPFTFIPFFAGVRNCIGQKYANIKAKIIIIMIINRFRILSITQLDELLMYIGIVAHTETPIKLRLDPRETVDLNMASS